MIDEPAGLVPRWFDDVLSRNLPLEWRAFYLARFAAASRIVQPITPDERSAITVDRAPGS
jgi:hypothetical protein